MNNVERYKGRSELVEGNLEWCIVYFLPELVLIDKLDNYLSIYHSTTYHTYIVTIIYIIINININITIRHCHPPSLSL